MKRQAVTTEDIKKAIAGKANDELVRRVRLFFHRHKKRYGSNKTFKKAYEKFFETYGIGKGRKGYVEQTLKELEKVL